MSSTCEELQSLPWCCCKINNEFFMLKFIIGDSSYSVMLSDLENVYFEKLLESEIQNRSKELNPQVETSTTRILNCLSNILNNVSTGATFENEKMCIKCESNSSLSWEIKCQLSKVPFIWHFIPTTVQPSSVFKHIVEPLLHMVSYIKLQNDELLKIISKKDEEIGDYKIGGARVSRKHLETKKFERDEFMNSLNHGDIKSHVSTLAEAVFTNPLYNVAVSALQTTSDLTLQNEVPQQSSEDTESDSYSKAAKSNKCESHVEFKDEPIIKQPKCQFTTDQNGSSSKYCTNEEEESKRRLLLHQQDNVKQPKKLKKKPLNL